eukprot:768178-Hanusia_phi.AAC.2
MQGSKERSAGHAGGERSGRRGRDGMNTPCYLAPLVDPCISPAVRREISRLGGRIVSLEDHRLPSPISRTPLSTHQVVLVCASLAVENAAATTVPQSAASERLLENGHAKIIPINLSIPPSISTSEQQKQTNSTFSK